MTHVIFYGEADGELAPLLEACGEECPHAVVLLGCSVLPRSGHAGLSALSAAGVDVRWLHGRPVPDAAHQVVQLHDGHPRGRLHQCIAALGGMLVAGLGGVFEKGVWYPKTDMQGYAPAMSPLEAARVLVPDGLRLRRTRTAVHGAIFPGDHAVLRGRRADVLASFEAPTIRPDGFFAVDKVAYDCHARLVVHAQGAAASRASLPTGVPVRGVDRREVLRIRRGDLPSFRHRLVTEKGPHA